MREQDGTYQSAEHSKENEQKAFVYLCCIFTPHLCDAVSCRPSQMNFRNDSDRQLVEIRWV